MQIQYKTKYEQQAQNQLQNQLQNKYQKSISNFNIKWKNSIKLKNVYVYIFSIIYIVNMYKLELLQPLANIVFAIEELHKHDKAPFSKGTSCVQVE